jgi:hypothetical protein
MPDAQGKFTPPKSGTLPTHGKHILEAVYSSCRREHSDKELCAKEAWAQVRRAGYQRASYAKK